MPSGNPMLRTVEHSEPRMRSIVSACIPVVALVTACTLPPSKPSVSGLADTEFHDVPLDGCNLNDFDTPPIIKSGHRPLYPVGRLVTGETGSVKAEFAVTSAGDITDVQTTVVGASTLAIT